MARLSGYSRKNRKARRVRRGGKRGGFGSAGTTHTKKSVRSGRIATKIARQSIAASRNGRCGDALYALTRAFHVQGVGWAHFTSMGKAGNKIRSRKSSVGHRVGRIAGVRVSNATMDAYRAFSNACVK